MPPVDSYKIQWKQSSGSWDMAADVSETTRGPSFQRPVSHFLDGLTPGVEYNIRVIATDSVGDSEPSNEVTYTKPATGQQSLSNTPAEGEPRIDGFPEVGQTLSADTPWPKITPPLTRHGALGASARPSPCRSSSWPTALLSTLEWGDWYNRSRLFGVIGYVPPAEYEASDYHEHVLAEAGTQ